MVAPAVIDAVVGDTISEGIPVYDVAWDAARLLSEYMSIPDTMLAFETITEILHEAGYLVAGGGVELVFEHNCTNRVDDDDNGLVDCADPDC